MKKKYQIKGMTCASCQAHVRDATKKVKGVIDCNVNLLNNSMDVLVNDDYIDGDIETAVKKSGYEAYLGNDVNKVKNVNNYNKLYFLIASFILLLVLMYVSMGNMMFGFYLPDFLDMKHNKMGFVLIQFIILIPICILNNGYLIRGFKSIIRMKFNMDTLVFIGVALSILYGIFAMFMISYGYYLANDKGYSYIEDYHMNIYFESAAMILCFVSLGKYLEEISKEKTKKSIKALIDLSPKLANVIRNNNEITIDTKDVIKGDILIVRQGDIIPVDGRIVKGEGSINESNITGESIPLYKKQGDFLYSSTILENGYIELIAEKVGEDTSFNTIIRLVEEAANSKAPISKLADKISKIFVPLILVIATITFIVNILIASNLNIDNSFSLALNFAITVVVIACPCALGLATPVAIMVSTGKGALNGIIIKNASILENTSKIDTIIFDKTGTITNGKPIVTDYINKVDYDILDIIYELENKSIHPLAKAIIEYTGKRDKYHTEKIDMIEGMGLSDGIYYFGNKKYLENKIDDTDLNNINNLESEGKTVLILYKDIVLGYIALKDTIKENTKELFESLNELKINTVMLTGDNEYSANIISSELGIKKVYSNVLPSEKGEILKGIKENANGLVAMVGDGVNDAKALANSDIAISIKNASNVAIEASDIILLHNDLFDIYNVIKLSRRTLNTIKLCLFWAFFYNFICVILATGFLYYINGFKINPMYGSIAMSISSVSVVLTALSINLFKFKKKENDDFIILKVKNMMCQNCEHHVEDAVRLSNNILSVKADHKKGIVKIIPSGNIDLDEIKNNINKKGYKVK